MENDIVDRIYNITIVVLNEVAEKYGLLKNTEDLYTLATK